ncbi:MAG TPA: hypothetical protein VGM20_04455 [Gemmatimonadales bacterium]|jgi:hypothetical protein
MPALPGSDDDLPPDNVTEEFAVTVTRVRSGTRRVTQWGQVGRLSAENGGAPQFGNHVTVDRFRGEEQVLARFVVHAAPDPLVVVAACQGRVDDLCSFHAAHDNEEVRDLVAKLRAARLRMQAAVTAAESPTPPVSPAST